MTERNDYYDAEKDPDNMPETTEPSEEQPEQEVERTPLEEMELKAQEYLLGWQRCQADYKNLQRDTQKRISDHSKFATEGLLEELLPLVDYFKFAFKGVPEAEKSSPWLKGVEHIQTNFISILKNNGVEMMEVEGKPFDANLHDAVGEVEQEGVESGIIVEEVTPGFTLNGKVVRHAKVKVSK